MGAKDSKISCISYEDSLKRVTDIELRRLREAFKRSAGAGGTTLSRTAFSKDVLCDGVPTVVADWLFNACGGTQKGIAFKELVCGLVLLTRGTKDEKIRFLWTLYCNDSNTHINKQEFVKALQIESTYEISGLTFPPSQNQTPTSTPIPQSKVNHQLTQLQQQQQQNVINSNLLLSLFGSSDRVTFEQFRSWITIHKGATVLSRWLLLESCVNLSSELETPTFYQSLAGVTHLEEQDIGDLEKVFWLLKGSAVTGQLDLESLGPLISPPVPKSALSGVFLAFDENRDGHIDFKELCCGVSAACRGPSVERSKFCFKVFDTDRDGVLNHHEIQQMVNVLLFVAQESSNSNQFKSLTFDNVMLELYKRSVNENVSGNLKSEKESVVADDNKVIVNDKGEAESFTTLPEFTLTQEDFLMWSIDSCMMNLVQPFQDLLFEVCHIVFGLRPQCRHLENEIVKGWLTREVRRGYRIGQFWYLISSDWWHNWKQYTQQSLTNSPTCIHCKMALNYNTSGRNSAAVAGAVDEAMICDESFTSNSTESMGDLLGAGDSSSLGSGSSGISCGRVSGGPPGPIDNSSLIASSVYKNIQTLTGEGGRLKREITLAQHRDFELVPDSLWKALAQWYGGPLPLPRQVILPPPGPDVELELYPLNLRILRHQNPPVTTQSMGPSSAAVTWGSISGGYGAMTTGNYSSMVSSSSVSNVLTPPKKYLAYTAAFSRLATIRQVGEFLCQRLKLRVEDIRLWHICNTSTNVSTSHEIPCLLEEEHMTLQDILINDDDQVLLEIRNKDLTWPEELGSLTLPQTSSNSCNQQERRSTIASIQSQHPPGATGLHNLGNTCFMNSALQVLFNTQPLTQYFRQNMHFYELNTTNKLGTKGQLALKYAELLKEVWTASSRSIAPLKLRFCVTKHAPQFAGGGQHDSQELLDWLLDGLHEDLNRVMEKPYSELKDSDGRADSVVAAEAWHQHHARNQSIVTDLFYGQLKSKVSCLGCGNDSVRFDPFSLLSLPLPVENYVYCEVLVTLLDGSTPIKYGLRLNSETKYWDLKKQLSPLCLLDAEQMIICELKGSQIKLVLSDDQKIKPSTAFELFVYELPKLDNCLRSRASSELGNNIEKGLKDIQRNQDQNQMTTSSLTSTTTNATTISSSSSSDEINLNDARALSTVRLANNNTTADPSPSNNAKNDGQRRSKPSKNPTEMGTSPECTFNIDSRAGGNFKTISTTNLLFNDNMSTHSMNLEHQMPSLASQPDARRIEDTPNNNKNDENSLSCTDCSSVVRKLNKQQQKQNSQLHQNNNLDLSAVNATQRSDAIKNIRNSCYLIAVHRKLNRQDTYFLSHHKSRPCLFGVPILIPCYDGTTNKDLYCSVWVQVARLLSPLPPTPPDQANHATDCDDSLGYDFPFTLRAVTEGATICALCPWSRFCLGCEIPCNDDPLLKGVCPTQATETSTNSSTSSLSSREQTPTFVKKFNSLDNSTFSPSSPNLMRRNNSFNSTEKAINTKNIHIAIDWDPTALHLRYQSTREKVWTEHSSVAICRKQQTEPVDLDHCLRAFTSEEKLEQCYHCAHCKGKQPATKKLQIWKLPPILIVHLKRFNYVNNKWVKSQKVVNFPFSDFDPTPYLASVPQETILRHKELSATDKARNLNIDDEIAEFDRENSPEFVDEDEPQNHYTNGNFTNGQDFLPIDECHQNGGSHSDDEVDENTINEADDDDMKISTTKVKNDRNYEKNKRNAVVNNSSNNNNVSRKLSVNHNNNNVDKKQRQRLVSTSLTRTPVIDGEFIDYHNHKLKVGEDKFDLKYQLYAVVSHSGMLNGGHYISYAANPNGSWFCYNDSSCREIPQRPNIDPSSAYLLFYERQGLDTLPYLPKVDGKPLPNSNLLVQDDNDNDLKKMCVIA